MFELLLRVQHDCPFNDLSRKYPETRISQWCNSAADVLEIEADSLESFEGLQHDLNGMSKGNGGKILSKTIHQGRLQLVAKTCVCARNDASTSPIIERNNFMGIPPVVLMGGWEHYRLLGFDESDVKALLRELDKIGRIEVLHKKTIPEGVTDDAFVISLSSLFGQLTQKQLNALLTAVEGGYYEIPKRVTTEDLAKKHSQPRTTFEEHIRKAESKVVHAMLPFMMMYARVPGSPFADRNSKNAGLPIASRMMKQFTDNSKPSSLVA